jgi:hypothetical protein
MPTVSTIRKVRTFFLPVHVRTPGDLVKGDSCTRWNRGHRRPPRPPRANLEQYHNRAKSLVKACKSGDSATAVRAWARQWLESLAALADGAKDGERTTADSVRQLRHREIDREVDKIERDARDSELIAEHGTAACSLADAQLFLARLHDFVSWPKFSAHIEALAGANSPDAEFESRRTPS